MKLAIISILFGMNLMALIFMIGRFVIRVKKAFAELDEQIEEEQEKFIHYEIVDIETGEVVEQYDIRAGV